ncbi:cytochrome-c peroxidase [Cupriavidus sp. USMAA2-4]|uniref:cytochrome-c peroxidase n=1 Tax=Cupriavidus sp. USMAA2-4 TaxID=876364 RepID=UPI000B107B9E|nr:cytochrome c peroxidase [Cupriavidus sp. USMAA2-4]
MEMPRAVRLGALVLPLLLAACGGDGGDGAASGSASASPGGGSSSSPGGGTSSTGTPLSLAAQVGQKVFFDKTLSGGQNMSCASCHDPAYAYGPPNSLAVQLGSDPTRSGLRAVPSLRYKEATPAYSDSASNPDGVTLSAPGGGFMWDGRADSLASQAALPLLNPVEMNNTSQAAVVAAVQKGSYAALFTQAFGASAFSDTAAAFASIGQALQAFQMEEPSFHPYSSKFDLYLGNKIGGTLTAAELRGLAVFNDTGNCFACHYSGANFNGTRGLMTDFTYQALGVPRNDNSIPGNPSPIPKNSDSSYFDLGLCGPERTDHTPSPAGSASAFCGLFKVPTLRNIASRTAFFHNGVLHSLQQVVHFYNTRDTHPEYWYPSTGGSGSPTANPGYALFAQTLPGATPQKFNDLPATYQGNVDEEVPMGTGKGGSNTLGSGTQPRLPGDTPAMTEQDISDLICFLNTLSDGYQAPATPPTNGTCVN